MSAFCEGAGVRGIGNWFIGSVALLSAGAAPAQIVEHHVKVGEWAIAAEPERKLCKMYRYYGSSVDDHTEGLVVRYDVATEGVSLTWSTDGPTPLPHDAQIDLHLNFVKGKSFNEEWGSQSFRHRKLDGTRYFTHAFGPKDSRRILADLAGNELIGLYLGPVLMTALSLDAGKATDALRECSLMIPERRFQVPLR